jgi:Cu-Zn family superoxide dismutase
LLLTGCGDDDHEGAVSATFEFYDTDATAVTYDDAIPSGSEVELTATLGDGESTFTLALSGAQADRKFGAHLHTGSCSSDPDDAGPHYQHELDPVQPSTDPAYANPENEVWLDLTTDSTGNGESEATVQWVPRDDEARSVVIHAKHTMTGPGQAGLAGDRLACVNLHS